MTAARLRPIRRDDVARIHEWASRPEGCRYQSWGPNTEEETAAFVESAVQAADDLAGRRRVWVAELPDAGVLGIGELKRVSRYAREITYAVHIAYWGRGLGTQIGKLLLEEAFADTAVERVQATCDPRNLGSATVLDRLGMTLEGTLRHTLLLRDGWRDSRMYSLLRHEMNPDRAPSTAGPTS